jgi:hypothetical protein
MLERCQGLLTSEVRKAFPKMPEKVRRRFHHAAQELQTRLNELT